MMCARVGVNRGIFSTCVFATVAQVAKMLILPRKNKEKQREVDDRGVACILLVLITKYLFYLLWQLISLSNELGKIQ